MYPFESSWLLSFFSAESLVTESSLCPNTRVDCTATDPWLRERGGVGAGTATSRCPLPAVPPPGALHCAGLPSPSPPPTVPEMELTASLVGLPAHAACAAKDTFKLEKKKNIGGVTTTSPALTPLPPNPSILPFTPAWPHLLLPPPLCPVGRGCRRSSQSPGCIYREPLPKVAPSWHRPRGLCLLRAASEQGWHSPWSGQRGSGSCTPSTWDRAGSG